MACSPQRAEETLQSPLMKVLGLYVGFSFFFYSSFFRLAKQGLGSRVCKAVSSTVWGMLWYQMNSKNICAFWDNDRVVNTDDDLTEFNHPRTPVSERR